MNKDNHTLSLRGLVVLLAVSLVAFSACDKTPKCQTQCEEAYSACMENSNSISGNIACNNAQYSCASSCINSVSGLVSVIGPESRRDVAADGYVSESQSATRTASISIFNEQGNLVRTLENQTQEFSDISEIWDGRDELGDLSPSGLYTIQVTSDGEISNIQALAIN